MGTLLPVGPTPYRHRSLIKEATVVIQIHLEQKLGRSIYRALKPEVEQGSESFTKVQLRRTKSGLKLTLTSQELSQLRAAVNSYLRITQAAVEILEQTEKDPA